MYAERSTGFRLRPASLGAALAINGGVIAALLFSSPELIQRVLLKPPIITFDAKPEPAPPPPEQHRQRVERPNPLPSASPLPELPHDPVPLPPLPSDPRIATGSGGAVGGTDGGGTVVTPPPLTLFAASFDPRYAADLQPPYPDTLRDAGLEGVVKLRVLIGIEGRVVRAEPLEGNPALLKLAVRHALGRWRFRPATRGGVPEESWKTMAVRFRLDG